MDKIVRKFEPITLVGGAPLPEGALARAIVHAPDIVAADGGAAPILRQGLMPQAVIGDMDSLSGKLKATLPASVIYEVAEQDSTDFEKCLMRIEAPLIAGLGFLGGRLDHQLAVFHGLMRFAGQRCLLLGENETVFLCPARLELPLDAGTPVSLFPLAPVRGAMRGLKWSFDALDFAPGHRIGTSNEASGPVSLTMNAPAMLCILPAHCFEIAFKALREQPGSWPARA
ncbi:thiamine diphosphokinase [Planktotalea arctica]|uniref:thiamine diphosphokinase n=1 Tax=Planktotalea arctica TaxID=1481893 RepID=UPI000A17251A|nr:thiamine diphosphokinase [Planktotalea arctica]